MSEFDKTCECGHIGKEHLWTQKGITKFAFDTPFLRLPQEMRGMCKKCTCPEYHPPKLLRFKRKIEYSPRENNPDDSENRCGRCGRLLENHENIGHPFKK